MSKKPGKGELDEDVHISYEDQSKINKFAINNTKMHEFQDDLEERKKELQNVQEAIDELVILDETDIVPFQYGEVFTYLSVSDANTELEKKRESVEQEIKRYEEKLTQIKKLLGDLKVQLYAKFGNKINLEEAEE